MSLNQISQIQEQDKKPGLQALIGHHSSFITVKITRNIKFSDWKYEYTEN